MANKAIRVKTNTKVVRAQKGNAPVKIKSSSGKGGFLTERIALTVQSKKK